MGAREAPLSQEVARSLLQTVAPGSDLLAVERLEGSFSNSTDLVHACAADGSELCIVPRRYAISGDYDRGAKARREFRALQIMHRAGVPVPEPLYLDDRGALLGTPGIVTRYVPGRLVMSPPYPPRWAYALAGTLARIHSTPCGAGDVGCLLDARAEALWFLRRREGMPDYVRAHPQGLAVWQALLDLAPRLGAVRPAIVHIDYWSGNVLWGGDEILAVVDWEEASYGDPGIDVGYCRMDMVLSGESDAADEFLAVYEATMGAAVADLALWELAAAIRPMKNPAGWVTESPAKERFAGFVDGALRRARLERRGGRRACGSGPYGRPG